MKALFKSCYSPTAGTAAQASRGAALVPSCGQSCQSHTHVLCIWNSTCGFSAVSSTVAAVSLIAIISSFCISFKNCTLHEISKIRIFLMPCKMQMGRFGWQRWPWQSRRDASHWAVHRNNWKAWWMGIAWEVMGKPTTPAVWVSVPSGRQRELEGSVRFQMTGRVYWFGLWGFVFEQRAWDHVHFGHVLRERCGLRTSASSHLWSWVSTENSWGIFVFL